MIKEKDYTAKAQALLPRGPAWTRSQDANLTKLLSAFGLMFAEVDERALRLSEEANPASSSELLQDWERVCNLPDKCTNSIDKTIEERRNDIINRLNGSASPTWAYFQRIAERIGYKVKFREMQPFTCGLSHCGDALNNDPGIRYNMVTVFIGGNRTAQFRCGTSQCGEALGAIRHASELECFFNHIKPAHVQFTYSYEPAKSGVYELGNVYDVQNIYDI